MSEASTVLVGEGATPGARHTSYRLLVIGLISFLTLVDLFAAQAILPTLTKAYHVSPAMMGTAVNSSTLGMAISGLVIAFLSQRIDRRNGIWISLALLAIPTALLSTMPPLQIFSILRIIQGVFMSAAFSLTMTYLGEAFGASEIAGALAAYVTGNVACNLFGRLMSATVAGALGLRANFFIFAALNLAGALLVFFALKRMERMMPQKGRSPFAAWAMHFRDPALRASFAIGFLILFIFLGAFTYVNFVLSRPPIHLSGMSLGLVYFVFFPSLLTTPLAGRAVKRFGSRPVFWASFAVAGLGLPLLLAPQISSVLAGLVLVAAGTFFAQAAATGFVSRRASSERGAASGLYLASYYCGGLAGSAILGFVFDTYGWPATICGLAIALAVASALSFALKETTP